MKLSYGPFAGIIIALAGSVALAQAPATPKRSDVRARRTPRSREKASAEPRNWSSARRARAARGRRSPSPSRCQGLKPGLARRPPARGRQVRAATSPRREGTSIPARRAMPTRTRTIRSTWATFRIWRSMPRATGHVHHPDDARHALGRSAVALRRGRERNHRSRQPGPGDHRRTEIRRERRTEGRLRRDHEEVTLQRHCRTSIERSTASRASAAPARRSRLQLSTRCAEAAANSVVERHRQHGQTRAPRTRGARRIRTRRAPAPGASAVGCSSNSSSGPSAIARARCVRARIAGGSAAACCSSHSGAMSHSSASRDDALARLRLDRIDLQRERHRQILRKRRALEQHRASD